MRDFRDQAPEPEVEAALAVIDATLSGEPVAPEDADLAELALILVGERPPIRPEFARELDERARRRFRPDPRQARRRWRVPLWTAGSMAALAAVALAAVLVVAPALRGSGTSSSSESAAGASAAAKAAPGRPLARTVGRPSTSAASAHSKAAGSVPSSASTSSTASSPSPLPASPSTTGRQVVQSAQISLATTPSQVDSVAQHVFDVASRENGVVDSSTVTSTGTPAGYAQIQLTVPSSNLEATMTALSNIDGARVTARTDNAQDITGEVGGFGRRLFDAKRLRESLLRQLAAATTTAQIDSLQQRLRDVEAQINDYETKLAALHRQVRGSQVSVSVDASLAGGAGSGSGSSSGGFTLHKALHDAARVLVVAAGVAVIALAVLVPLGLAVGLAAALARPVRRRRREQALDLL